jgi:hypothetical protein
MKDNQNLITYFFDCTKKLRYNKNLFRNDENFFIFASKRGPRISGEFFSIFTFFQDMVN